MEKYTEKFYYKIIDYMPEYLPKPTPKLNYPLILLNSGEDP